MCHLRGGETLRAGLVNRKETRMTLIIGYGSTLRCDDGIGYIIAEQLMDAPSIINQQSTAEVIARHQLTPDLADAVHQADQVIFIDACADAAPGEVRVAEVKPSGENWGAFAHEMSPGVLLDCVKDLYGKTPRAHLITIGGEKFDIGEGLTPTVQAAIPAVLSQLSRLVAP